jgi:putative membrane protein insertion efficiency factor
MQFRSTDTHSKPARIRTVGVNLILSLYSGFLSPLLHLICGPAFGCRFVPTCSQYASEALTTYGWIKGSFLSFLRISRCHPFAHSGYDPVPHVIARSHNPHQGR